MAVGENADGRLEVFAQGRDDDALYHKWQLTPGGSWSGWESLGGVLTSSPDVARYADGRLVVFVKGTDNAVWLKWQLTPGGSWSGWYTLGGVVHDLHVATNANGSLVVFALGSDDALWYRSQAGPNSTGWYLWSSLGGVLPQGIDVAMNADGRLEVFGNGTDNGVWHKWQLTPGGSWSAWYSLGDAGTLMDVARNLDGRLEIFTIGPGCELWHKWQSTPGNAAWSGGASLGGNICFSGLQPVAVNADGRLEAFAVMPEEIGPKRMWHKWQWTPGGSWSDWAPFDGFDITDPTIGRNADGRLEIFAPGPGEEDVPMRKRQLTPGNVAWSDWAPL
jgi:hypothetical protein